MKPEDSDDTSTADVVFSGLPERVKPEDMVIEVPASDPGDPELGRNTNQDFTLKYMG